MLLRGKCPEPPYVVPAIQVPLKLYGIAVDRLDVDEPQARRAERGKRRKRRGGPICIVGE
jgi:hypothetical protein